MYKPDLSTFLKNHTAEETSKVLDEVLTILVMHTEFAGLSDNLVHQYLTIKELREVFASL